MSEKTKNDLLYLLIDGTVKQESDLKAEHETVLISNYPNFFGQESFWNEGSPSPFTYTAQTIVKVFVISSKQIKAVLEQTKSGKRRYKKFHKLYKEAYSGNNAKKMEDQFERRFALEMTHKLETWKYKLFKYSSWLWDIFNAIFVVTQCLTFLWGIAFFSVYNFTKTPYMTPLAMNWFIDLLFAVDIVVGLNPSWKCMYFYPSRPGGERRIRRSRKNIILDVITVIPFELLLLLDSDMLWKTVCCLECGCVPGMFWEQFEIIIVRIL